MSLTKEFLLMSSNEMDFDEEPVVTMRSAEHWFARCHLCPWDGQPFSHREVAVAEGKLHEIMSHR